MAPHSKERRCLVVFRDFPTDPELSFPITAPYSTLRPYSLFIQFDAATTAIGEHTIRSTN